MKSMKKLMTFLFMCLLVVSFGYSANSAELKDRIERKGQMHPEQVKINYYLDNYGFIPEAEYTTTNARDCESGDPEYSYSCDGGSWQSEVSWTLSDGTTGAAPEAGTICLADGDYTLSMVDAYGDGWNGNVWTLFGADGTVYASCTLDGANDDGSAGDCSFSLGGAPPVSGCTNPNAPNYDADAVLDDGSCEDFCLGNTDSGSCGYWMDAGGYTCDQLIGYGYDCTACSDAGVCDAPMECTDTQWMCASGDQCIPASYLCDGSSEFGNAGWGPDCGDVSDEVLADCCDAGAPSYDGYCAGVDDIPGCTDAEACNFDDTATFDDGTCLYNDCYGECGGSAVEDCTGECGGSAMTDDCGVCEGDGSACAGCVYPQYFNDGWCDSANNTPECSYDDGDCCPGDCPDSDGTYDCALYGGDCLDCINPDSADLAPGGECDIATPDAPANVSCEGGWSVTSGPSVTVSWDAVDGADQYEVFYYFETCEEQGLITCLDGSCAATEGDCPELSCADIGNESWISDGYCDAMNNNETCGFEGGECSIST